MPIDWEALAGAGEDELVTLGQVFSGLAIEGDGDEELAIRQLRDRLSNVRIAPDTAPAPPPTSPPFMFSHIFMIDLPEPTEATETIRDRCAECVNCLCHASADGGAVVDSVAALIERYGGTLRTTARHDTKTLVPPDADPMPIWTVMWHCIHGVSSSTAMARARSNPFQST